MKRLLSLILALALCLPLCALAEGDAPATVSILVRSNLQTIDASEMGMFRDAAQAANVAIEWTQYRSGWDEKKAVTLASNDYPDLFISTLESADLVANLESFADMSALIEQYAPNVARMFEEMPETEKYATYNGGIYCIPFVVGYRPRSLCTLSINKTWLDELGLEIPTTLEEFEACLIAFRDNDCNGNGDPTDEIPFNFMSLGTSHDPYALSGTWGVVDCQSTIKLVLQDGKVSFLFEHDAYYKLTQFLHHLYESGLVTPEVMTNDYTTSSLLGSQGDVARVGASTGYSPENLFGKFADQYVVIPALSAGEEYTTMWPSKATSNQQVNSLGIVMSASCENKEAAMRLINELYSDDFAVQSYFGSFDTGLTTKYEDGTYSINMPQDYSSIEESKWVYSLCDWSCGYFSERVNQLTTAPAELMARIDMDNINQANFAAPTDIWPTLITYSEEDSEAITYLTSDIRTYFKQKTAEWIVYGGIEDEWDEFQSYLKAIGIDQLRDIYQAAYDAYYAEN